MGILTKGIFGGFVNKTGPLVGRNVKGQNLITGLHHKSNKKISIAQHNQNLKFTLVIEFLKPIKGLIASGFKYVAKEGIAFNEVVSYNFKWAVTGSDGTYLIDYSAMLYSKGGLEGSLNPNVTLTDIDKLLFTWQLTNHCDYNDEATFLVYSEDNKLFSSAVNAVKRSKCEFLMELPRGFYPVNCIVI
ncbi:DUF6266 family protein [Pedobacter frigoris]|uniref:Uncharacterized protein n=1 Tax=Pedobacter frigoris TaxID=2571272 RepID=A0A4U1CNL4_9SPHI|nr:DUF6266 family protein [Pedobacter frigoris]TKC09537.1 hypothetical protein FA047_05450 [Pedobacter frigoris]